MAKFSKATYELVSDILSQGHNHDEQYYCSLVDMIKSFADDFEEDNCAFDRERFYFNAAPEGICPKCLSETQEETRGHRTYVVQCTKCNYESETIYDF